MASDLWTVWATAQPVLFTDLDFDETSLTHAVQIVSLTETVPAVSERHGDSHIALELVEL